MPDFQDQLNECDRGTRMRIARECGITHAAVSQWSTVPADRVLTVEKITGIARHILRPDLYPIDREVISSSEAA